MKPTEFKDAHGKSWDCKINLGKALQVDRSDFTALTPEKIILSRYDQDALKVMITDTAVLFAVIGVLVHDQCEENLNFKILSSDDEDKFQTEFTRSIDGPCIERARTAFVEALQDFFPAAKTVLSTFLKKLENIQAKASMRLENEIYPLMDQELDNLLDDEISKIKEKMQERAKETS